MGLEAAVKADNGVRTGLNTYGGKCVNQAVAESVKVDYTNIDELI